MGGRVILSNFPIGLPLFLSLPSIPSLIFFIIPSLSFSTLSNSAIINNLTTLSITTLVKIFWFVIITHR